MSVKRNSRVLPKEIFLSHSTVDRKFTDKVAKVLRNNGIAVWYSRTHLRGAQQWQKEIGRALQRCDWFVVILSPKSVNSMWVNRELSYALSQKRFENKIVPVLYQVCDFERLHWSLAGIQMVDLTGNFADGYADLLKIWRL